jgi:hypothetical protein
MGLTENLKKNKKIIGSIIRITYLLFKNIINARIAPVINER